MNQFFIQTIIASMVSTCYIGYINEMIALTIEAVR